MALTSTTIEVTWEPLPADQENGPILHYAVMVMVEQIHASFTLNVTSISTIIPNLHPAYSYSIVVAAVNINVRGPFSMSITVTTPDDGESNQTKNVYSWYVYDIFSLSSNWPASQCQCSLNQLHQHQNIMASPSPGTTKWSHHILSYQCHGVRNRTVPDIHHPSIR